MDTIEQHLWIPCFTRLFPETGQRDFALGLVSVAAITAVLVSATVQL